jgi:small membrane protein
MGLASFVLLIFVLGLFLFDVATTRGRNRRALLLEGMVFLAAGYFIVFPQDATRLAHSVGIGRGVDFLLYPIVLWLVREALVGRRRRLEDAERLTELTRALAIAGAQRSAGVNG